MKLYDIKHNGYTFGQKRGKCQAITALERHLAFEGFDKDNQRWRADANGLTVDIKDDTYNYFSIQENNGDK